MTAYLIDLDGTLFFHGTNKITSRGAEIIKNLNKRGDKIYFITARKEKNDPEHLSLSQTHLALKELGIQYETIIGDAPSPRVLINDEGATAYNIEKDGGLAQQKFSADIVSYSINNALTGLTWVSSKYGDQGDADDYVQTVLIAESLIESSGFNHLNIVSKLRSVPPILMNKCKLEPGGIAEKVKTTGIHYKGQLSKLIHSNSPAYKAKDGVSDGAAMRTLGIGAYFANNFNDLVFAASEIASITHASVEARLSSVLTALRFRQIFIQDIFSSPKSLYLQMIEAVELLRLGESANFFLKKVRIAASITNKCNAPADQLFLLARNIGIDHLCWSTPITATFWSFHEIDDFRTWMSGIRGKSLRYRDIKLSNGKPFVIGASTYLSSEREKDIEHLKSINEYEEYMRCHEYHYGKWIDVDTFFSISISMLAAKNGTQSIYLDLGQHLKTFNVDTSEFAKAFAFRLDNKKDQSATQKDYNFYL